MLEKEQVDILRDTYPFLSEEDTDLLFSLSEYAVFGNKDILLRAGQNNSKAFFILKGMVRGYFLNEKGDEKNIFLRPEHTITGAPESIFQQAPTKYTFEAVTETHLLLFNHREVMEQGFKHKGIMQLLLQAYQENIQTLIYRVELLIDKAPEERYEALLSRSPQFFKQAYNKHVANYLGITAVSLSRIMKRKSEAS